MCVEKHRSRIFTVLEGLLAPYIKEGVKITRSPDDHTCIVENITELQLDNIELTTTVLASDAILEFKNITVFLNDENTPINVPGFYESLHSMIKIQEANAFRDGKSTFQPFKDRPFSGLSPNQLCDTLSMLCQSVCRITKNKFKKYTITFGNATTAQYRQACENSIRGNIFYKDAKYCSKENCYIQGNEGDWYKASRTGVSYSAANPTGPVHDAYGNALIDAPC